MSEEENLKYMLDWGVKVISGGNSAVKEMGLKIMPRT